MIFSGISFLYYFLPITLLCYGITANRFKNLLLFLISLLFYCSGEPRYVWVLLLSCIFHYQCGKRMEKADQRKRKMLLFLDLFVAFLLLFYFKYFTFVIQTINDLFHASISIKQIVMPIGISFYTFQATSYIIDIYRGTCKSAENFISFSAYLTLFPQLIAGPIVRYETIAQELKQRSLTTAQFAQGIRRFIIGLAKKVLIANVLGMIAQRFSKMLMQSVLSYWFQAIASMLQLYFDFSGYSDMAIGLGLMLGFHFPENFCYPFIASGITDFWRRWHITLSGWFRDYLYIPLGGSRKGAMKQYRNILIVWLCTGLWHGAGWNFVAWGLYFAIWLILEKQFLTPFLKRHRIFTHLYTLILIIISFVLFQTDTLSEAMQFLYHMSGLSSLSLFNTETLYLMRNFLGVLLIASLFSMPIVPYLKKHICVYPRLMRIFAWSEWIIYPALLLICTAYIIDESFQPFLYFRF